MPKVEVELDVESLDSQQLWELLKLTVEALSHTFTVTTIVVAVCKELEP